MAKAIRCGNALKDASTSPEKVGLLLGAHKRISFKVMEGSVLHRGSVGFRPGLSDDWLSLGKALNFFESQLLLL
jgi:hypothetical protein